MKKKINTIAMVISASASCPSCNKGMQLIYHMRSGMNHKQFEVMTPEIRMVKAVSVEEHCSNCGYCTSIK